LPERLPEVAVDRVALRQAILTVLLTGIEHGGRQFQITASTEAGGVLLRLDMEEHLLPSSPSVLAPANRLLAEQGGKARVRLDSVDGAVLFWLPRRQTLILLVDDDPDFARLFERCLAGSSYSLATLPVGADIVARTQALRPAVIVLDVFLPSQDGWEVLQRLKGEGTTRTVPVLICSALANPALARTLGAAGCLPKPVTPRTLLAALERCRA
jgi:CheY-like chemotaxis protein